MTAQLVFICGGRGLRFPGRPPGLPKSLVELQGETLLARLWRQLRPWHDSAAPPVFVCAAGDRGVPAFVAGGVGAATVVEQAAPDGVANAVRMALPHLAGPALVVLADIVIDGRLPPRPPEAPALVLWPQAPASTTARNFGVRVDAGGAPLEVVEKPADPRGLLCGIGLYWLTPAVIERFAGTPVNPASGEREITAALAHTMRQVRYGRWDFEGRYFNVNSAADLAEARAALERPAR